jgi:hypothetical protein
MCITWGDRVLSLPLSVGEERYVHCNDRCLVSWSVWGTFHRRLVHILSSKKPEMTGFVSISVPESVL